jgi:hypothetical protein|tara:strand:+ start:3544 stop:3975 length:432 start_codon:yes stop_codon:yes gene_type:complete
MKKITLRSQRFDRDAFNATVNTEFTQLTNVPDPSFFDVDLAAISDFWYLYDKFFYIIPKLGEVESHQYLAKTSEEYSGFATINEEIKALLDEIAELRKENLELIKEATNLDNTIDPNDSGFNSTGRSQMENTPSVSNDVYTRG